VTELTPVAQDRVAAELERMSAAHEAESGWRPPGYDDVRGNEQLLYAHFPQIGCTGILLDRVRDRVHILGSAYNLETYLWAWERGFHLDADNVLVITAVRDAEATIEVLKHGLKAPYVRYDLAPQFANPPVRIELDSWSSWLLLRALQTTDAFDFEVNP
jgi:hypothetical protein